MICQVRLLYKHRLLPKNVERRQWVEQELSNTRLFLRQLRCLSLRCIVPKLNDQIDKNICLFKMDLLRPFAEFFRAKGLFCESNFLQFHIVELLVLNGKENLFIEMFSWIVCVRGGVHFSCFSKNEFLDRSQLSVVLFAV